jgi:hypothetical protein|nr:MAG TPA: hypothetical protein [Caudoviricetes sp.]
MGRIVGLEIFDDEVLTEPAEVKEVTEKELEPVTEPAEVPEEEPKNGGKKK